MKQMEIEEKQKVISSSIEKNAETSDNEKNTVIQMNYYINTILEIPKNLRSGLLKKQKKSNEK